MFKPSGVTTHRAAQPNRTAAILPALKAGRSLSGAQLTNCFGPGRHGRQCARRVSRPRPGEGRWPGGGRFPATVLALIAIIFSLGCRAVPSQPPFDLALPAWSVRQGQAVWRSQAGAAEIAGELLVATHPDGRSFVQFTKVPLPLVLAQATRRSWQIEFAAEDKRYSGRGAPPSRLVWFQLVRLLNGNEPAPGWKYAEKPDRAWRLEHAGTGEFLEGYLAPASSQGLR